MYVLGLHGIRTCVRNILKLSYTTHTNWMLGPLYNTPVYHERLMIEEIIAWTLALFLSLLYLYLCNNKLFTVIYS